MYWQYMNMGVHIFLQLENLPMLNLKSFPKYLRQNKNLYLFFFFLF